MNVAVASSNVFGVLALVRFLLQSAYLNALATVVIMIASTLMHLSEQKHKLPGEIPFPQLFLNLDRAVSIAGIVWFGYQATISLALALEAIVGLCILAYSERQPGPEYALTHVIWHAIVYHLLCTI